MNSNMKTEATSSHGDYISDLVKRNTELETLVAEKNEIIEASSKLLVTRKRIQKRKLEQRNFELQNAHQQNELLAKKNIEILTELRSCKEKLKELIDELHTDKRKEKSERKMQDGWGCSWH